MESKLMRDYDETARLVLMSDSLTNAVELRQAMLEVHPEIKSSDVLKIWQKYRGMDGRLMPTHDVETGERL